MCIFAEKSDGYMRVNKLKWFFLMVITMMAVSCLQKDDDTIVFEPLTLNKTVKLSNEDMSPSCQISLKLENALEENGHRAEVINGIVMQQLLNARDVPMKTAMEEFVDNYVKTYKQTMLPLYNQDRADTTKRAWYEFHYIISAETQQGSKKTIAYLATIDYYEGGVHGNHQLTTMNFDTETGRLITLQDIFADGTENQLNNILLKALKEKTGLGTLEELREKEYLTAVDIFAPQNFIIGDETITFIYNPSEIAPYTAGSTELIIPYSSMESILKNSFISSKL